MHERKSQKKSGTIVYITEDIQKTIFYLTGFLGDLSIFSLERLQRKKKRESELN